MKKRRILIFISGIVASLIFVACAKLIPSSLPVSQTNTALLVSAAASLQEALQEIKPIFQKNNTNVNINYNFGASGALQQQIEQGAKADIFFSAATKQMKALQQKDLIISDTLHNLLTNNLVLIVPNNSKLNIQDFTQLADSNIKKIAVGEFKSVPVGQYTQEVFKNLGILEKVNTKLVLGNTVRATLAAVESGNVDAGVIYATDAKISNKVKVVATAPENLHSPIVYPIAVIKNSKYPQVAKAYIQFLSSNLATDVFKKYGFGIAK